MQEEGESLPYHSINEPLEEVFDGHASIYSVYATS